METHEPKLIADYFAGRLEPGSWPKLAAHLTACAQCASSFEESRSRLPGEIAEGEALTRRERQLLFDVLKHRVPLKRRRFALPAMMTAALAAAASMVLFLHGQPSDAPQPKGN